jgi:hypothetical protein
MGEIAMLQGRMRPFPYESLPASVMIVPTENKGGPAPSG